MALGTARWAGHARAALVASLGASLYACTQPRPPAPPPVARVTPPPVPERPIPPHPERKPSPPVLAALPPSAANGVPPPDDAEQLQGLSQDAAVAMLGEPQQRAESPPAVLWRYVGRGCELDLYFYLDLQSREMRILQHEVRVTDGSKRSQQGCYGELVAARRADEARSTDRPR